MNFISGPLLSQNLIQWFFFLIIFLQDVVKILLNAGVGEGGGEAF